MRFETPTGKLKERIAWIKALYCPAQIGARFKTEKVKMPRRPRQTGGAGALSRRGRMTHAGLAAMAVAASLGPA